MPGKGSRSALEPFPWQVRDDRMAVARMTGKAPRMTYTCSGCPNTWGGLNSAHCSACHRTFSGVGTFDKHRVRGRCLDPAEIQNGKTGAPIFRFDDGIWRYWERREVTGTQGGRRREAPSGAALV